MINNTVSLEFIQNLYVKKMHIGFSIWDRKYREISGSGGDTLLLYISLELSGEGGSGKETLDEDEE